MSKSPNRYNVLIEEIFKRHFQPGNVEFFFDRDELEAIAKKKKIVLPKNLGDVIYSFRYRIELPRAILKHAPEGKEWVIRPAGKGRYKFSLTNNARILPNSQLAIIPILDSTPGLIERFALCDEQALLAKVRYNRLIDIFTGVTCYSLQNHLRTTAKDLGQLEVDELYLGVDRQGIQFVFPVQAKGGRDQLSVVQIEQDLVVCRERFPGLLCRPIAAQFLARTRIAMFELTEQNGSIVVLEERHYELTPGDQ